MIDDGIVAVETRPIVPSPLKPGDTVGVVSSSGPVEAQALDAGCRFLGSLGFNVITGPGVCDVDSYLAGSDAQRCRDLNSMISDPAIRGIFFSRGGYGVMRLLESLDFDSAKTDPKMMLGMSDLTALQLALYSDCGISTLSGPMIAGQVSKGLDDLSEESLIRGISEPWTGRDLLENVDLDSVRVIRKGTATGPMIGGCLSLITALLGTPYSPDYSGSILLIEEVREPLYRLDRMLTQMKLSGTIGKARGMVVGHLLGPKGEDLLPEAERLLLDITERNPIPIIAGVPHGHTLPNLTMPHGARVKLDTESRSLTVENRA